MTSYNFLKVQHRFTEDIMKIVNEVYDKNEKLKVPNNYNEKKFRKYNLNYNNDVIFLDTSFISKNFYDFWNKNKVKSNLLFKPNDKSFDQLKSLFNFTPFGSKRFNELNAFHIVKIIEKLIESNDFAIDKLDLEVICMTTSQKAIIKQFLKIFKISEKIINKIKIDTVDNFQGREKRIIIVDLIKAKNSLKEKGEL
ncbi:AAA domain-containing protein [Spiroplasma taiwanense]|uniref:AAA domain-containing protein n=1 Tax=Spiroplasma taiwanense TaxID=2145 RepID=UPI002FE2D4EE